MRIVNRIVGAVMARIRLIEKAYLNEICHNRCQCEDKTVRFGESSVVSNPYKENITIRENACIDGMLQSMSGQGTITIGENSYIGPNTRVWAYGSINIGDHVMISHNCNVFDSNCHPVDYLNRRQDYQNLCSSKGGNLHGEVEVSPVKISDDVWIGANSTILKGVEIGARSIVAAGSVVTKSVPADVIVAGNPAKIVKYLVREELV